MTEDRYSRPVAAPLITDKLERAKRESENGLRQIDYVLERVRRHTGSPAEPFRLKPSLLLALNRAAVEGIEATAGAFRTGGMEIFGSKHEPPKAAEVPELIEDLCDYVNDKWTKASAAHLAAYGRDVACVAALAGADRAVVRAAAQVCAPCVAVATLFDRDTR